MKKIAIHCQTQEEYDQLMEIYEKKGWKRRFGDGSNNENYFGCYEELCVRHCDELEYCSKAVFQVDGYKILTFKELLEMEETTFKRGDRVLVRDNGDCSREERIYLTTIEGARYPYICVECSYENNFNDGKPFNVTTRMNIKPLPTKKELTLQEIADKFGVKVEDLRIKD